MKYAVVASAGMALLPLFVLGQTAQEVGIGDRITVRESNYLMVTNTKLVHHENGTFGYGDMCFVQRGAWLTVTGYHEDRLKVEYEVEREPTGTACPNKTQFTLTAAVFRQLGEPTPRSRKKMTKLVFRTDAVHCSA